MTDVGQGVQVLRSSSESWVPDDEVGGLVQVLFEDGEMSAGLWKPVDQGAVEGDELSARETVVVLQGTVRIEIGNGPTLELSPGDLATLPRGAIVNWYPSDDFVKVWISS